MSSRIAADLQRVDRAIRPGVSHRAMLKGGSVEAWTACLSSLKESLTILLASCFADQNGSAATWIQWRKSGTSKQLLGLLRAAIDEAPSPAFDAGCDREGALHFGIRSISFLFKRTQSGTLWPAMREWIIDQGGLQAIWQALAWSMALVSGDKTAHDASLREPVHAVIGLMSRPDGVQLTYPLSTHPSISSALTLLFSNLLPRDLASGNAHEWDMRKVLGNVGSLYAQLGQVQPQPQLHRAFLVAWPYLMGWLRQRPAMQLTLQNQMVRYVLTRLSKTLMRIEFLCHPVGQSGDPLL